MLRIGGCRFSPHDLWGSDLISSAELAAGRALTENEAVTLLLSTSPAHDMPA